MAFALTADLPPHSASDPAPEAASGQGGRPEMVTGAAECLESAFSGSLAWRGTAWGAGLTVWALHAPQLLLSVAVAAIPAGLLWRWYSPASFRSCVCYRLRATLLRLVHYGPLWSGWARAADLVLPVADVAAPAVPRLQRVVVTSDAHELHVRMLAGQTVGDYQRLADLLCGREGTQTCTVRPLGRRRIALYLTTPAMATPPQASTPAPPTANGVGRLNPASRHPRTPWPSGCTPAPDRHACADDTTATLDPIAGHLAPGPDVAEVPR